MAGDEIMSGWIKLYRRSLDSKYGTNLELVGLFDSLLLMANHKEGFTHDGTRILPGQLMTSQKELSLRFNLDRNKLRRLLKKLANAGQIEQQTSSKNTVITITNWSEYQCSEHQVNIKRTSDEHQVNINKNVNNNKNKKKNTSFKLEDAQDRLNSVNEKLADKGSIVAQEAIVLDYYNATNNRLLKHVDSTYKQIRSRLKEGYTVEEMKTLIDHGARVWAKDAFWKGKNRPSTLFNGKMGEYLAEAQDALKPNVDPLEAFLLKSGATPDWWTGEKEA